MPKGEIKLEKIFFFIMVLVVLIVTTIVSLTLRHLNLKRKHTMSMPATVVDTRTKGKSRKGSESTYYATFKLHNNQKREFELPKHVLEKVEIGKKGMITFTSKQLLHFKEGEHPNHLFTHFVKMNRAQ